MNAKSRIAATILLAVVGGWAASVHADPAPAVRRSVVERHDLRAAGMEGVMVKVEIPAGGREGRHTHPAEAFVYVLEGTLELDREGSPPTTLKAGDSFFIEPGRVHEGINRSDAPVKLVAVFATEKGKPLTTQAP